MSNPLPNSDIFDERRITTLIGVTQRAIKEWAQTNELWDDSGFKVPHEEYDDAPDSGTLFLVFSEGGLYDVWNGTATNNLIDEFTDLLEQNGCHFEMENHYTAAVYPVDDGLAGQVKRYQRFNWIKSVSSQRAFDIHAEIYKHFAAYPEDLKRLDWRGYEVILDAIFRNCGFRTELGPGSNDKGVDIRLYQGDVLGELVTLVQAKRYRSRPVTLESVAALSGIVEATKAHRGLFVTTSRYLPSAQRFARLEAKRIELAGLTEVQNWCGQISETLAAFLATGNLDQSRFLRNPASLSGPLVGSIVYANVGYNCTIHEFCRVVAETRYEVILEPVKTKLVSGHPQIGMEIPVVDEVMTAKSRFIAFRKGDRFWGKRHLYSHWDGKPVWFNSMD